MLKNRSHAFEWSREHSGEGRRKSSKLRCAVAIHFTVKAEHEKVSWRKEGIRTLGQSDALILFNSLRARLISSLMARFKSCNLMR